jgi:hypothetical protein
MSDLETKVRALLDGFVKQLVGHVRAQTLAALAADLGAPDRAAAVARPARGAKSAGAPATSGVKPAPRVSHAKPKVPRGGKRDPRLIAELTERLGAFVKENPGKGIREAGKDLGTATRDLQVPMARLLAAGTISMKGTRSSATYSPR